MFQAKLTAAVIVLWIVSLPAMALPYATYIQSREDGLGKIVLRSIGAGIHWSNVQAGITLGRQLYCPPDNVAFNEANYDQIMIDFVHDNTQYGDSEVELALLHALMDAFPCD